MAPREGIPGSARELTHRPTLGLLVDWLEDDYQNAVLCGVLDAARDHDANVYCFAGGVLDSPARFGRQRNAIYSLPSPANVAGLVVMAGTIGNHVGAAALATFLERFRPLPMCSIAMTLPGVSSVLVDNATGVREALLHLIDHHGIRRIACIRGPEANPEAEGRLRVFREILTSRGLPLEDSLMVTGDFQEASGAAAIDALFGSPGKRPAAIVAFNDDMALGALRALRARGIRVPEDVALVGFDDVDAAEFANPPLTTVRQPLREQGARAAELVLAALRGDDVPERVTLHTELITRHSCGCRGLPYTASASSFPNPVDEAPATALDRLATRLPVALARQFGVLEAALGPRWAHHLTACVVADLGAGAQAQAVAWLNEKLEHLRQTAGNLSLWHRVLDAIRRESLAELTSPEVRSRLEDLCHEGRRILGRALERRQADLRLRAERWARTLSRTGEALITSFDTVSLANAVAEQLPRLEIPTAYLALYVPGSGPPALARLILAHDPNLGDLGEPARAEYPCQELLPRGLFPAERRYAYVIEPLFFREEQLGFALFELGPRDGVVYEALRDELSAALKGAHLVREVVEKDLERQQMLRDLERRGRQLQDAHQALEQTRETLREQTRLASLGRLTAGFAHDLTAPLAAVRAALDDVTRIVAVYTASTTTPGAPDGVGAMLAQEIHQGLELARMSAGRAAGYLRGIELQTREPGPEESSAFDAVPPVREALWLLSYALREANCAIRFEETRERIDLVGSPGRLAQLVTNLVSNAIDASVPKGGGSIHVALHRTESAVELVVTDNGVGILAEVAPRIFEPWFTTKPPGQGTGLGLSTVREIVTRDFGGAVEMASTPGLGATFTVRFPRRAAR